MTWGLEIWGHLWGSIVYEQGNWRFSIFVYGGIKWRPHWQHLFSQLKPLRQWRFFLFCFFAKNEWSVEMKVSSWESLYPLHNLNQLSLSLKPFPLPPPPLSSSLKTKIKLIMVRWSGWGLSIGISHHHSSQAMDRWMSFPLASLMCFLIVFC